MATVTLDRTFIHSGEFYGPGEVEVPDEIAEDLEAKQAALIEAEAPPEPETDPRDPKPRRQSAPKQEKPAEPPKDET
jgi:outer membrane biosynthesis protein TonB